jgi:hypothetical protein
MDTPAEIESTKVYSYLATSEILAFNNYYFFFLDFLNFGNLLGCFCVSIIEV